MSARENPMMDRIVSLEMCGMVQDWRFEGDAVHLIAALPARLDCCRVPHCWFVNRDGKTRCWLCDEAYVKERGAQFAAGVAAEQELRSANREIHPAEPAGCGGHGDPGAASR